MIPLFFLFVLLSWLYFCLLFLQWDHQIVLHPPMYSYDGRDCGLWVSWDIWSSLTMDSIGIKPKYHYWKKVKQREEGEYKERGEVRWGEVRGLGWLFQVHTYGNKISSFDHPISYLITEWDMANELYSTKLEITQVIPWSLLLSFSASELFLLTPLFPHLSSFVSLFSFSIL